MSSLMHRTERSLHELKTGGKTRTPAAAASSAAEQYKGPSNCIHVVSLSSDRQRSSA